MTPHEGLMSLEVFDQALARVLEYRDLAIEIDGKSSFEFLSLCGEGEPLLNPKLPEFVRRITASGLKPHIASNGSLLDERRATALLDAGLKRIALNVGEIGEDYERVYKLPWQKTSDNVNRFISEAKGQCEVVIVLVDHRQDPKHAFRMTKYWQKRGVEKFIGYDLINRGGSLKVDRMDYENFPVRADAVELFDSLENPPRCGVPLFQLFIGYDGQYYLCCSDWQKQVPFGSVFDRSFMDIVRDKIAAVTHRELVCRTCSADPLNMLTEKLQEISDGKADASERDTFIDLLHYRWGIPRGAIETYDPTLAGWEPPPRAAQPSRPHSIPVRAL